MNKIIFCFLTFIYLFSAQADTLKKVSLQLQWKHQFENAGFYAAVQQGYYKNVGLDVDIKEIGNENPVDLVLSGEREFGISYSSLVAQYYNGKPIIMLANIFKHSALVLLTQKEILMPTQLKGKTVMGTKSELTNTGLGMMLQHFDISIKDFNVVPNTYSTDAFAAKKIDAMTAFITNQPHQLNKRGIAYNILSPTSYGSQFYDVNLFTSAKLYKQDPKMVMDFKKASIKGWKYALEHSDEIIQLILKKYNTQTKDYEALRYEADIIKSLILPDIYPLGSIDCNIIEKMKQDFIKLKIIPSNVSMNNQPFLLDNSCVQQNSSLLSPAEKEYLLTKKVITVCADPNWMPFEMIKDAELVGMSSNYLSILSDKLNIPFKLIPTKSWTESLVFAKQRQCDILSLAMKTPTRLKYMNFTQPYISIPLVIATTSEKPFVLDIEDKMDKTFGIVKGYAFTELLKLKHPNLKLVEFDTIEKGLEAVNKNKVYGFLDNLTSISYQIQKRYIGSLKITSTLKENFELGIGVRNDDALLLSILDKALYDIDTNAKHKIHNQWTNLTYQKGIDYSLLWKVLAFAALLISVLLYRYIEVRRYNFRLTKLNHQLKTLSTTDVLTNIRNRRFLDEALKSEYERALRYTSSFSIILVDIDDFKAINDTYGHDTGDTVLIAIASILNNESRNNDLVGRWGGEEFMIVCPHAKKEGAMKVAQKLRVAIQENSFEHNIYVTASFGVLEHDAKQNYHWHITSVDDALYQAKREGKNRVQSYN